MGSYKQTSRAKRNSLTPKRCEIEGCTWKICVQRHRIRPGREGGKYVLGNVIALCPNHHWMADRDMLSREQLQTIVDARVQTAIDDELARIAEEVEKHESESASTRETAEAGYCASAEPSAGDADSYGDAADVAVSRASRA